MATADVEMRKRTDAIKANTVALKAMARTLELHSQLTRDIHLQKWEEADRNARAYGWECARTGTIPENFASLSEDNPFLDPNWRQRYGESTNGEEQK